MVKGEFDILKDAIDDVRKQLVLAGLGTVIGMAGLVLAWYWFGWKLVLVLFFILWGDNMTRG